MNTFKKMIMALGMLVNISACAAPQLDKPVTILGETEFRAFVDDDESVKKHAVERKEQEKHGYVNTTDTGARETVSTVREKTFDRRYFMPSYKSKMTNTEADTYVKPHISHINLAFSYPGTDVVLGANVTGAAPAEAYIDGRWTGVGEYFDDKGLGACSLHISNMRAAKGAVVLSKSEVEYTVNSKATVITVKGTPATSFEYQVVWVDDNFYNDLRCVQPTYDSQHIQKLERAASTIDKNIGLL